MQIDAYEITKTGIESVFGPISDVEETKVLEETLAEVDTSLFSFVDGLTDVYGRDNLKTFRR